MKMKEFGPPGGGARPWRPPLDPPMLAHEKTIKPSWFMAKLLHFMTLHFF